MTKLWVEIIEPIAGIIPRVEKPAKVVNVQQKLGWVAACLLIFLVCSQVPLYGIRSSSTSDPFSFYRVMLASNKGTLMELGISPLVTSSMIMQMLAGAKVITVDHSNQREVELFKTAENFVGLLITLAQAILFTFFGTFGPVAELGLGNSIMIVVQLSFAGVLVLMLDQMLSNGYGLGSAISLFIACNICENIFWQSFSFRVIETAAGPQYQGSIIALFHLLVTRSDKIPALKEAFYRTELANITNLLATLVVFCVVIFFQGFRVDLPLKSTRIRAGMSDSTYKIKLFYTSNIPIILQSALVSNIFMLSQMLYTKMGLNYATALIGRWMSTPSGRMIPVGGLVYYMSAPRSLEEVIKDPIHAIVYILFVLITCAVLSYSWLGVSGSSPQDVAKQLKDQGLTIRGHRQASMLNVLQRYIPTAAALGGLCVGGLTVFADFMGALGSGTGILLAVGIIITYIETIMKEQQDGLTMPNFSFT